VEVVVAQQAYLSPKRFTLGAFGVDITSFTAAQLRQKLVQATGMAETFCNRSINPQRSDMRGGTITNEQHMWPIIDPTLPLPGDRRVYLNSGPIKSVTGFAIDFTNHYLLTLPPENLYINSTAGYIEVVATQPTIIGYPPLGIWFGLSEPVASVSYTYGWEFPVTGDPLEADSPLLYYASHGNWMPGGDVTVTVAGAEIDPTDYTVNTDDGSVLFADSVEPTPDQEVLADYTYVLPQQVSDAIGYIATDMIGQNQIAARGMLGLTSLRVAEVSLTQMQPGRSVTRNGVTIPERAADLLGPFALGRIGG
jgi:hypothetical protein